MAEMRDGEACGGSAGKCRIVPYGVSQPDWVVARESRPGPLHVLFAGTLSLRKGIQYAMQAAGELKGQAVIRAVGSAAVSPEAMANIRSFIEVTGPVPVHEMAAHYDWADVVLLPSLCEGSAAVLYEAMSQGLPIICTPSSGSVLQDGVQGILVPERDAGAIASAVRRLADDADCRCRMSLGACRRAEEFSLEAYGRRLLESLDGHP